MLFTFHNVSINSRGLPKTALVLENLHSIMYLLIRIEEQQKESNLIDLHSIMYLLIHHQKIARTQWKTNLHSIMYLLIQRGSHLLWIFSGIYIP